MTRRDRYDAADNARKSYDEAIAAMRERQIRAHILRPRDGNATEQRWWAEGVRTDQPATNDNNTCPEVPFSG